MSFKQKKILLLAPSVSRDSSKTKWLSPSIGVYRIAGYLKKHGHYVECIDLNLSIAQKVESCFENKLSEMEWDIIGFSVLEESLPVDIANMHLAKKLSPGSLLVAGGVEAQNNYQNILDKSPCRICVLGEGEQPMVDIADEKPLHEIPGVVFKNLAVPLDQDKFWDVTGSMCYENIPYEDYWDYYTNLYANNLTDENIEKIHTVRVFTRNYCPMGCKFCCSTNQLSGASGVKKVNVVDIIDERLVDLVVKIVKSHPRTRTIYFTDDNFCIDIEKVKSFCERIISLKLPVSFICFSRLDNLDEETIALMAKAGFRVVNTGLESFSKELLKKYGKKLDYEKAMQTLDLFTKYGIVPLTSVILCGPEATLDDVEVTVDKLFKLVASGRVEAGVNVACQPYKGSFFHEQYHDVEVEIITIPGTNHKLRKEYFIRSQDPEVRELQYRFLERYPETIQKEYESGDVVHMTSSAQAMFKLTLLTALINELKDERKDPVKQAEKIRNVSLVERGIKAIHSLEKFSSGSAL